MEKYEKWRKLKNERNKYKIDEAIIIPRGTLNIHYYTIKSPRGYFLFKGERGAGVAGAKKGK